MRQQGVRAASSQSCAVVFRRLDIKASARHEGQLCAQEDIMGSKRSEIMVRLRCEKLAAAKLEVGAEAYLLGVRKVLRPAVGCICECYRELGAVLIC